ncbi:hypothetical protein KYK29_04070 [Shinella daejeonensis]|uniref:hypothetical protein n=1 Tax=Shinella daejeonensis TaxID=659017 RepID=UPI0020C7BF8B|nr:hypothetical protein [Shinella daejeonensis]MCP8894095.1 hypothetical protein [Shinella daejeonensis]
MNRRSFIAMLSLAAVLFQNLFTRVGDRVEETVAVARRNAIAFALIGLMILTAYVLAVVAGCILLAERYGAVPALFGLAGGFVVLALIVYGVLAAANRRERELARLRRERLDNRRDLLATAAALTGRKPLAATGLALAIGFLLAPKSRRRSGGD